MNDQRIERLADALRENGGVRINIESWASQPRLVEQDRARLRAAAKLANVKVKIETVDGYFVRATVI